MGQGSDPLRWTASLLVVAAFLLTGCAGDSVNAPLVLPGDGETPLGVSETEFSLPLPRQGDRAVYAMTYEWKEGDDVYPWAADENLRVAGETTFEDGYGERRPAYQVNVTIVQGGREVDWQDVYVDLATNEQMGFYRGAVVESGRRIFTVGGAGAEVLRSEGVINSTGEFTGRSNFADYFSFISQHGGIAQGRALAKSGSWSLFNPAWDLSFDFTSRPVDAVAELKAANLTALSAEAFEVTIRGAWSNRELECVILLTPGIPYSLSLYWKLTRKPSDGDDGWSETYTFNLKSVERGTQPVKVTPGEFEPRPAGRTGGDLGDTFPLGGSTLLPFTSAQAKEAAKLMDPDVANWFNANPKAFLATMWYDPYDLPRLLGAANQAAPASGDALKLAVMWTEWVNPETGKSLGFLTESHIVNGVPSPPTYERYPYYNLGPVSGQNFYEGTWRNWIKDRSNIASLKQAEDYFQATAGPHAGKDPTVVGWFSWGNTYGGGGGYFLSYVEFPSTWDYTAVGTGVQFWWNLHFIFMGHDGFKFNEGVFLPRFADRYSAVGTPLPLP